ncbi:MAG: TonB-dependent receptor [Robiginitomaculum sp.]
MQKLFRVNCKLGLRTLLLVSGAQFVLAAPIAFSQEADEKSKASQVTKASQSSEKSQSSSSSIDEPVDEPVDEVVVTATGMRTVTTSQIMNVDQIEIGRLGLNNVDDLMRIIPQNFSNINSSTNNGVFSDSFVNPIQDPKYGLRVNGAAGTGANFRGLGNQATLTLVNGRRLTQDSSSAGAFSDISIIPLAAIDHVEVLTDGASTAYGSGAIAGVVNFILKKDFNGTETSVRYENSETGGDRLSISQVAGYSNDIARIIGGITYTKSDPVLSSKAVGSLDLTSKGGRDHRSFEFGSPGVFIKRFESDFSAGTLLGSAPAGNASPALADLKADGVKGRNLLPLYLTPKQNRKNGFLSLELDINDTLEFFVEGLYSQRNIESIGGYIKTSGNFHPKDTEVGGAVRQSFVRHGEDDIVHPPADDLRAPQYKFGYIFDRETDAGLMPRLGSKVKQENFNLNLGLNFELPVRDWKGTAAFYMSRDDANTSTVSAPRGQSRLSKSKRLEILDSERTRRFPDTILMLMKGYSLDGSVKYKPLNLFGDGTQNSKETLNQLYRKGQGKSSSGITGLQSIFEGTLGTLPGGDVKMAFGAEVYREKLSADYINFDGEDKSRDPSSRQNLPDSERDAIGLFGEVSLPLVGETNARAGIHGLQIGLALRYDKFTDRGVKYAGTRAFDDNLKLDTEATKLVDAGGSYGAFSPKIGVAWQPSENTSVFFNWSKSFRAPTLYDRFFLVDLPDFDLFHVDPHAKTKTIPNPDYDGVYDTREFINVVSFGGTLNDPDVVFKGDPDAYEMTALFGGNSDTLKPVTANNFSVGFDHDFVSVPGLKLGFKYAYIDIRNEIASGSNERIFKIISDPVNAEAFSHLIKRRGPTVLPADWFSGELKTDGRITFMDRRTLNIAKKISETIDFSADYSSSVGKFEYNLGAVVTHTLQLTETIAEGVASTDLSGTSEGPQKWQGYGYIGVGFGNWYGRTNIRYQSSYRDLDFDIVNPSYKSLIETVSAYTTVDANISYAFDDSQNFLSGTRVSVGVNNIFSADFPVLDKSPGFDLNRVDARKRVMYIDVKKSF